MYEDMFDELYEDRIKLASAAALSFYGGMDKEAFSLDKMKGDLKLMGRHATRGESGFDHAGEDIGYFARKSGNSGKRRVAFGNKDVGFSSVNRGAYKRQDKLHAFAKSTKKRMQRLGGEANDHDLNVKQMESELKKAMPTEKKRAIIKRLKAARDKLHLSQTAAKNARDSYHGPSSHPLDSGSYRGGKSGYRSGSKRNRFTRG